MLDQRTTVLGNTTGKVINVNASGSCNTTRCIYLIGCTKCQMKYVGFTKVQLNRRFSEHRSHIRCGTESYVMLHHFTKHHGIGDMTIKILEICALDKLREREKFWINELNTSFPYGLNDRIDEGGIRDSYIHMKTDGKKPIYTTFNKHAITRGKRAGNNRKDNDFDPATFIDDLFQLDTNNFCWLCKKMINELKLHNVKKLLIYITNKMENNEIRKSQYTEYPYHIFKDICMYRFYSKQQSKNTNSEFFILEYVNGLVDKFNFKSVLRKHKEKFPGASAFDHPNISYRYTKTIRSQVVNYKNPDKDAVCHCEEYSHTYVDEHHHHVMTGDLNLIENANVRDLIAKGLNFRETQRPDKTKALQSYQGAIDEYIGRMSMRLSIQKHVFTP